MALGLKPFGGLRNSARVPWVQLAVVLKDTPVGGDALRPSRFGFLRGVGRNPRKNPRGQRAGKRDVMFRSQGGAQFVDGCQLALGHLPHQRVDFQGGRDNHGAFARPPAHRTGDLGDLW